MKVRWSHFTTMEMVVFISPVYVYCFAHSHFTNRLYVKFTFAQLWVRRRGARMALKRWQEVTRSAHIRAPIKSLEIMGMWERADQAHFRGKGRAAQAGASCMFLLPHRWRICRLNPQPTYWQPVSAFKNKMKKNQKTLKHGQKHFHLGISQAKTPQYNHF